MKRKLIVIIFVSIVILTVLVICFKFFKPELLKNNNTMDASNSKVDSKEENERILEEVKNANKKAEEIKNIYSNEISEEEKEEYKKELNQIEKEISELHRKLNNEKW